MRTLLILEDSEELGWVLKELVKEAFDAVFTAQTLAEAERVLACDPVTHLVSDLKLDLEEMDSRCFLRWRRRWPSIEFLAVFTGADVEEVPPMPGSDRIYLKPGALQQLIDDLSAG